MTSDQLHAAVTCEVLDFLGRASKEQGHVVLVEHDTIIGHVDRLLDIINEWDNGGNHALAHVAEVHAQTIKGHERVDL